LALSVRSSRVRAIALLALPIVALLAAAFGIALAIGELAGFVDGRVAFAEVAPTRAVPAARAGTDGLPGAEGDEAAVQTGGSWGDRAAESFPPAETDYECLQPALEIPRDPACEEGAPYPRCRWQLPEERKANGLYAIWRNTTPEHRWGRPGLVSLVLASAREYARRWPGERVTVGDLDAPGPRHQTHDRGVDVDLYLEHAMIARNLGGRRYPDNYAGRPAREVAALRGRVMDLARILATCSGGRLRIYYNDPEIVSAFRSWFAQRGFVSDVGPPMLQHNPLHRFHFHLTTAEDLAPLPVESPSAQRP
jgi:hypothetical protein